jgi:hypothetical protein
VQVHAEAEERLGLASDAMADKTALEEERKRTELAHHAVHAAQRELRECQIEIEDLKANLTQVDASRCFPQCSSQRCSHTISNPNPVSTLHSVFCKPIQRALCQENIVIPFPVGAC